MQAMTFPIIPSWVRHEKWTLMSKIWRWKIPTALISFLYLQFPNIVFENVLKEGFYGGHSIRDLQRQTNDDSCTLRCLTTAYKICFPLHTHIHTPHTLYFTHCISLSPTITHTFSLTQSLSHFHSFLTSRSFLYTHKQINSLSLHKTLTNSSLKV